MRLPKVNAVPAPSSAAWPAADEYAAVRSIFTGSPVFICSEAWRSTLAPANPGNSTAPAPNAPPIKGRAGARGPANGAKGAESIAPVLAPPAIASNCGTCSAIAPGTCDATSLAAESSPSLP